MVDIISETGEVGFPIEDPAIERGGNMLCGELPPRLNRELTRPIRNLAASEDITRVRRRACHPGSNQFNFRIWIANRLLQVLVFPSRRCCVNGRNLLSRIAEHGLLQR